MPHARVMCVAAHPDDETIGAGALLARAGDAWVVHVTDGAPRDRRFRPSRPRAARDEYARERRVELERAMELAGIDPRRALRLGAVDLEAIDDAPRAARELEALVRDVRPDVVVTHPYEGGHPDHDAAALVAHAALARLARAPGAPAPALIEMTSYHGGAGRLVTHAFLAPNDAARPRAGAPPFAPAPRVLSLDERARKRAMLACFASQAAVLAPFASWIERTRPAPRYAFDVAPHAGALWYERLGMQSGDAWRARAMDALGELGIGGPA